MGNEDPRADGTSEPDSIEDFSTPRIRFRKEYEKKNAPSDEVKDDRPSSIDSVGYDRGKLYFLSALGYTTMVIFLIYTLPSHGPTQNGLTILIILLAASIPFLYVLPDLPVTRSPRLSLCRFVAGVVLVALITLLAESLVLKSYIDVDLSVWDGLGLIFLSMVSCFSTTSLLLAIISYAK